MTYFSPFYLEYIHSDAWMEKRQKKFAQVGRKCQDCGATKKPGCWLEVHHLTYKRLGHEWLRDLRVVCNGPKSNHCHDKRTQRARTWRMIKSWF